MKLSREKSRQRRPQIKENKARNHEPEKNILTTKCFSANVLNTPSKTPRPEKLNRKVPGRKGLNPATQTEITTLYAKGYDRTAISKIVGAHRRTVARYVNAARPELERIEQLSREYQARLGVRLPIVDRVELLAEIAEQDEQPMAALKALERADWLDGLRFGRDGGEQAVPHAPLFSLPSGSQVMVNVLMPAGARARKRSAEAERSESEQLRPAPQDVVVRGPDNGPTALTPVESEGES